MVSYILRTNVLTLILAGQGFGGGGANLLIGQFFLKNSMKMKEIGPRGGTRPWQLLGSANV